MEIYIESFLIQNILINFCLLRLVFLTTKTNSSTFRLFVSSSISAGFSVVSAIFITNITAINFLKLTCAVVMILIAFKSKLKNYIYNFILLFIYTFAFGGAISMFCGSTYFTNFGAVTSCKFNLEIITLSIIILTYIFNLVAKPFKLNFKSCKYIYEVILKLNNETIKINAYLDTGNLLEHNGNPVIIVDFNSYLKLTNNDLLNYFKQTNSILTNTVAGENCLKIFKIDTLEIIQKNKKNIEFNNQYIAVSTKSFNNSNYQALLSPLLF